MKLSVHFCGVLIRGTKEMRSRSVFFVYAGQATGPIYVYLA